ncbi:MAG: hypothetical protein CV087_02180 [Candidatus Brocadia sp. WS118]|nr:MAG: hypothetical protein CV087_02180 [Candidatus Brocadia sp. WS118]
MDLRTIKTAIIAFALAVPMSVMAGEGEVPNEYTTMKNPFNGSDKSVIERGEYIYSKKCVKCHGEKGDGAGLIEGITMPVFNKEFFSAKEDGYLFWHVKNGVSDSLMPSYGPGSDDNLSVNDIWKAVAFIRERFGK